MSLAKPKACILYIDDEHSNRIVFQRAFDRDFNIKTAETAEQGLEILTQTQVAVLVTDQRLPGMLGTDLLQIAKVQYPNIIRMVLTAYSDIEVVLRAINEGLASRYIIKPWVRPMLQEILTWGVDMNRMKTQLEEMQIKLVEGERLSTMGTLLASVAHDIKNPLGYVGAYVETLGDAVEALQKWVAAMRAEGSLDNAFRLPQAADAISEVEELPRIVRDLTQGVNHVYTIVEGIQLHARRPARVRQPANPAVALEYATKLAKGLIAANSGMLHLEVGPLPHVVLSTSELSQVLVNLLTNAAHALGKVTSGPRQVKVTAVHVDGGVRFEVSDSGAGMAPDVLDHAFEEFFTTKPPGEGTGLGLPISKRVVESAGGKLWIDSTPHRGTTVSFWIPESAALSPESTP